MMLEDAKKYYYEKGWQDYPTYDPPYSDTLQEPDDANGKSDYESASESACITAYKRGRKHMVMQAQFNSFLKGKENKVR